MGSTFAAFQGKLFPFLDSSVYLNVHLYFELNFILLNFPSVDPPIVPWTINPFLLPRGSPLTFWRCYDFSESPFSPRSLHFLPFPYSPTCAVFQLVLATGKHWGKIKRGRSPDIHSPSPLCTLGGISNVDPWLHCQPARPVMVSASID